MRAHPLAFVANVHHRSVLYRLLPAVLLAAAQGAHALATASIALTSSVNPSDFGANVTLTATVSGASGTPTGSVTFNDGEATIFECESVPLSSGAASCTVDDFASGMHSLTATYAGDGTYNPATSAAVQQSVGTAPAAPALSWAVTTETTPVLLLDTVEPVTNLGPRSAMDAAGNLFVAATTVDSTRGCLVFLKYDNADGHIDWRRDICIAGSPPTWSGGLALDAAGEVFGTGQFGGELFLARFSNSTGETVWQQKIPTVQNGEIGGLGIGLDAAGDVRVFQKNFTVQAFRGSDGAPMWLTALDTGAGGASASAFAVDSSGNSAVSYSHLTGHNDDTVQVLARLDSAGNLTWTESTPTTFRPMRFDAQGNLVVGGVGAVAKYLGTTGALAWNVSNPIVDDLVLDASGNAYVTGQTRVDISSPYARKLDASDGHEVWMQILQGPTNTQGWAITLDAGDNPVIAARATDGEETIKFNGGDGQVLWVAQDPDASIAYFPYSVHAGPYGDLVLGQAYAPNTSTQEGLRVLKYADAGSAPNPPTQISPSGTISTVMPTYTWNASSGAVQYTLLVQNTAGVAVNMMLNAAAAGCGSGTGTCSIQPSTSLSTGTAYSWFVKATNSGGLQSAWSDGLSFFVNGSSGVPGAPTLVAPDGTISTTTPTYTWNAVSGATSYNLVVQNTSGVAVSMSVSASAAGCGSGSGTCAVTPSTALANNTSYAWFVNASNAAGTGPWSDGKSIFVSAAGGSGPPPAPTLVSPSGTIATTTPTYTWNALSGATSYYLLVQNTAGVAVSVSVDAGTAGCASGSGTCSFTPSTALMNNASYAWFVNASNASGTGPWSNGNTIFVSASGPGGPPAAPTLVSPSGNISTTTPTYTWNAVAGAASYELLVQNTAGVAVDVSISASAAGCGGGSGTCSATPSTALAGNTAYAWFVNASNASGTGPWSAGNSIHTP